MRRPARHELVWLSRDGWQRLWRAAPSADGLLAHWAAHDLPLVVTRRPPSLAADRLALGLPAPQRWGGRRLALDATLGDVARVGAFPTLAEAAAALPGDRGQVLGGLAAALGGAAASVRVYGSHGWQCLSGLDCLHPGSDLDLLLPAADAAVADALCARLDAWPGSPRLDGELLLPGGRAVAWREWRRAPPGALLLVKDLGGAGLLRREALFAEALVA